jgi:hypothetical protein
MWLHVSAVFNLCTDGNKRRRRKRASITRLIVINIATNNMDSQQFNIFKANNKPVTSTIMSRDSSVGIATGYGLDDREGGREF